MRRLIAALLALSLCGCSGVVLLPPSAETLVVERKVCLPMADYTNGQKSDLSRELTGLDKDRPTVAQFIVDYVNLRAANRKACEKKEIK